MSLTKIARENRSSGQPARIDDGVMLATANLPAWSTVPEVMEHTRRSRSFILELVAAGELVAVQHKRGRKGSPLLVSTESLRAYLQRSLVHG